MKLRNTARHILVIPLNSGRTIHLAPGEVSEPLSEVEVVNNPTIKKLTDRNWISRPKEKIAESLTKRVKKKKGISSKF